MTRQQFIRAQRTMIDEAINHTLYRYDGNGGRGVVPNPPPKRNDAQRWQWVINDELLYRFARSQGVRV